MPGVFPDIENHVAALEAAAIRLRQTNQIGGQAQERAEQLRVQLVDASNQIDALRIQVKTLETQLESAQTALAAAQQWWFDPLRAELANAEYANAVAAKDAVAVFAILTTPVLTPVKEVPAARLNAQLATMRAKLKTLAAEAQEYWAGVLASVPAFTTITMDDPLTVELLEGAQSLGLLTAEERSKLGKLPVSPLDRLGIAAVVTAPAHVAQAMGW
jgi:hypothetical protein